MCKVSIIVPIYNAEKYIEKCLDSLLQQTINDYEVILMNDGSTDQTLRLIQDYVENFPNIFKVYTILNSGQGKARNQGVKYAKGEFIAFVDSDDYVAPTIYEELYQYAIEFDYDLVVCPYYRVNQSNEILNIELNSIDNITMINTSPWNKLFKRNLWLQNDVQFAEHLWYEDVLAVYEYMFISNSIGFYKKPLYYYVYREESSINIYSEKVNDIFIVLDELYVYLDKKYLLNQNYDEIEAVFILHAILGHLSRCANEASILKRHRYIKEADVYMSYKFDNYLNNRYMKLKKPLLKNKPIDYIKWCSCKIMYIKLFDFLLLLYRIIMKFSIGIKKW